MHVFSSYLCIHAYNCVQTDCARVVSPRADGAKRRAKVLIPPGYLHPGKRKH